ncbi:MAG: oligosaccharide flippase family protein [Ignavibacteriaceae bacterium]|nr:oligosaccharide flippase family protein [Ignavibacteriaceae bacterium]
MFIIIARFYGPKGFGQFSVAFTVANLCIIVADFGFDVLITSEVAKKKNEVLTLARKYFSLKIVLAIIGSILTIIISTILTFSSETKILIYTLTLYVLFTTLTNFFYALFRGLDKFEYETINSFCSNLLLLFTLALIGLINLPLFYVVLTFIAARLVGVLLGLSKSKSLLGDTILHLNYVDWKLSINSILIFGLTFLFGNLLFQLDTLLLGIWKGDVAAGLYQAAFRIMLFFLLVPDLLVGAFLPVMSKLFVDDFNRWKNYSRILYKFLLFSAIPISLILFYMPAQIITLLYGKQNFSEAETVLQIFSAIILIRFTVEPLGLMLTTSNRQFIRMSLVILATILSFFINALVIPIYGLNGAALVSLGINLIVGLGYIFFNYDTFLSWNIETPTIAILIYAILFSIFIWFFKNYFILVFVMLSVYLLLVLIFGFSKEERKLILSGFQIKQIGIFK